MSIIIAIIFVVLYTALMIYVCITAPIYDEEDKDGTEENDRSEDLSGGSDRRDLDKM